jgi:glycosyltransferase involved in cell wall biosynthesis
MRVMTYLPELEANGGVSTHVLQLTAELARRGHSIDLLAGADGDLGAEFQSFCESVRIGPSVRYGHSPGSDLIGISRGVWNARRLRPDVIYANNFSDMVWAAAAKRLTGASVVLQLHEFAQFRQRSMSTLGRRADSIVVASRFLKDTWTDHGLAHPRIEVVPCGIAPSDYPGCDDGERALARQALGIPADAYVVLYFGRLIPEKGVEVLLDAWRQMDATPAEARLLVLGSPAPGEAGIAYLEELKRAAPPGCEWLAMRPEVIPVLHAADLVAVPSVWDEPFGRVIIEAMATGCPVVASRVGGIPEILDGPLEELLFDRGDSGQLADLLRRLRSWRTQRPGLGDQCRTRVLERYSLADLATAMTALFSHQLVASAG